MPLRHIALLALAGFGIIDIGGRLLLIPITGRFFGAQLRLPVNVELKRMLPSPGRDYEALLYEWEGAGLDPGCAEFILVVKGSPSPAAAWQTGDRVYTGECERLAGFTWAAPADGRAGPQLRINADVQQAQSMSRFADGGKISIAFASGPEGSR